ncbi:5'-nucleotidase domain-containing protein 1, partial [Goodea atripinnis]
KYYFYDNYFDLPGALLCGKVVDMLHKRGNEVNSDFWKDMVAAIDHNYNTSAFKATWRLLPESSQEMIMPEVDLLAVSNKTN